MLVKRTPSFIVAPLEILMSTRKVFLVKTWFFWTSVVKGQGMDMPALVFQPVNLNNTLQDNVKEMRTFSFKQPVVWKMGF